MNLDDGSNHRFRMFYYVLTEFYYVLPCFNWVLLCFTMFYLYSNLINHPFYHHTFVTQLTQNKLRPFCSSSPGCCKSLTSNSSPRPHKGQHFFEGLPETNSLPLKMMVSNRNLLFQGLFSGDMLAVSFREGMFHPTEFPVKFRHWGSPWRQRRSSHLDPSWIHQLYHDYRVANGSLIISHYPYPGVMKYDTNPNFMHYDFRKIPQNDHRFGLFDPPNMGNLMTTDIPHLGTF